MGPVEYDVEETVKKLLERKTAFLNVVESLEDELVNSIVNNRQKAVEYLTDVLLRLPGDYLNELEVSTLLRFYSARLSDSVLLTGHCLKALYFLSKCCKNFTPSSGVYTVLSAIFKEHMVQSLVQSQRLLIFDLIQYYLEKYPFALQKFDTEFILGFVQAADGEKDPRIIMSIFNSFYIISTEFNLGPFAEDMFELISCYFPVDFKPPPDDTVKITAEQLSEKLHTCLTSNSAFAPYCYQLIDENFAATGEDKAENKLAVLNLLHSAIKNFSPQETTEHGLNAWRNLRHVILNAQKNSQSERLAFECLRSLIVQMYKCTDKKDGTNSELSSLLSQISNDCVQFLSNAEMQLIDVAAKLVACACDTTAAICDKLANRFLPLSLEKFQTQRLHKLDYAGLMMELLKLLNKYDINGPYLTVKDSVVIFVCDRLLLPSLSIEEKNDELLLSIGFIAACCMLKMDQSAFTESQLSKIVLLAADLLNLRNEKEKLRQDVIIFLQLLSHNQPNFVENFFKISANSLRTEKLDLILNLQAIFIVDQSTASKFLPNLLNFDSFNSQNLNAIRILLDEMAKNENSELKNGIFRPIFTKLVESYETCGVNVEISTEKLSNMEEIAEILQDLVEILDSESENDLIEILLDFHRNGKFENHYWSIFLEKIANALSDTALNRIASKIDDDHQQNFIDKSIDFCEKFLLACGSNVKNERFALSYSRMLAVFANKLESDNPKFDLLLKRYLPLLREHLVTGNIRTVEYFASFTKALLLRNFQPLCNECLKKIIDLLNSDRSDVAERALEFVFVENYRFLSARTKSRCSLLYKQRIFTEFVRLIQDGFQTCRSSDSKKNYFKILSVALSNIPQNVQLLAQIEQLIPLLVNSLDSDDDDVLTASLGSLEQLLTGTPETVEKLHVHVLSVCDRLCKLAQMRRNMTTRLAGLKCLTRLAVVVNPMVLNPWRRTVIKNLSNCLDDPKRIVRRAAADCTNKWYTI